MGTPDGMGKSRGRGKGDDEARKPLNALKKKSRAPQVREFVDYDYVGKLSASEKRWLNDFTDEFYMSKSEQTMHNRAQKLENWNRNKAARRDVTSRKQTTPDRTAAERHQANSLVEEALERFRGTDLEDALIDWIDSRRHKAPLGDDEVLAWLAKAGGFLV